MIQDHHSWVMKLKKKVLTNKHEKKSAGTGFRHITFAILGSNLIKHLQVHIMNFKKWLH